MRFSRKTLVAVVATLLVAPQLASADDVEDQLLKMQQRMDQMENQLQATNDQLDAAESQVERQQGLIEKAGLQDDAEAGSFLSRFLTQTEFGGHVAVSYNWNFSHPTATNQALSNVLGGYNPGALGLTAPLHRDNNTFAVDQVWFSARKRASEESRAGFGFQGVYGKTGDILGGTFGGPIGKLLGSAGASAYNASNGSGFYMYEGFVEYQAPILNQMKFTAGKFATPIGYETINQADRNNITLGILWAIQPVAHVGVKFDFPITDSIAFMIGLVNGADDFNFETDNSKTLLGSLSYTGETFYGAINTLVGGDSPGLSYLASTIGNNANFSTTFAGLGRDSDHNAWFDLVLTWDPTDRLHLWMNGDYVWFMNERMPGDIAMAGVAIGSRYGITERLGAGLRAEWVGLLDFDRSARCGNCGGVASGPGSGLNGLGNGDSYQWEITGTMDYALTEQLMLRGEVRYDNAHVEGGRNDVFNSTTTFATKQDQVLGLLELLYEF